MLFLMCFVLLNGVTLLDIFWWLLVFNSFLFLFFFGFVCFLVCLGFFWCMCMRVCGYLVLGTDTIHDTCNYISITYINTYILINEH